jgi:hypothetical protein
MTIQLKGTLPKLALGLLGPEVEPTGKTTRSGTRGDKTRTK